MNIRQRKRKTFYLGCPLAGWLEVAGVPLFVSDRTLRKVVTKYPRAVTGWALDSGGFTELSAYGGWQLGPNPRQYARSVLTYKQQIGLLDWAAPQDWMCEPHIIAKTGLSVSEHQRRTVANYLDLRAINDTLPFIPVLQGWTVDDYLHHIDMYTAAGVDLSTAPLVGVGSVCRRNATAEICAIFGAIHDRGVTRLHGFGVKRSGIRHGGHLLATADSMSWSVEARYADTLPACRHKNCTNCLPFALAWRERMLRQFPAWRIRPVRRR